MALDFNIIDDATPHKFSIQDIEKMASEAHLASCYFDEVEAVADRLLDKFGFAPEFDEIKLMVAYQDLLIKLHCES
jgi:hypothetical protein